MQKRMLLLLCLCSGCATTTSFTALNPAPHPLKPRKADSVEMFLTKTPERPYVEVGMIEARQGSDMSRVKAPEIIAALRAQAAKQGCDGVVLTGNDDAVVGGSARGFGVTTTLKGYRASCIVYEEQKGAGSAMALERGSYGE